MLVFNATPIIFGLKLDSLYFKKTELLINFKQTKLDLIFKQIKIGAINMQSLDGTLIKESIINGESFNILDIKQDDNEPFPDGFLCYANLYNSSKAKIGEKIDAERDENQFFRIHIPPSITENLQGTNYLIVTLEDFDKKDTAKRIVELNIVKFQV